MGVDLGPGRDRRRVSGSKLGASAKDCGGLAWDAVLGARDEGGEGSPAGGRGEFFVWMGRRVHEGSWSLAGVREGDI